MTLVPRPTGPGVRVHTARRRVRLGDSRPSGRLRLDAIARYLQDIAADDVTESGLEHESRWVVRATRLEVDAWPAYGEDVELATWCAGTGAAWAERRTSILVAGAPVIEAATVWVRLDPATMRPGPLTEEFLAVYGPSTGGRKVRSRLTHPAPTPDADRRRWPLRAADFDVLGHVNNAVAWVALEDELARLGLGRVVVADAEYASPISAAEISCDGAAGAVDLAVAVEGDGALVRVWLIAADGQPAVSVAASPGPT